MDKKTKQELLTYFWSEQPVYHPTKGSPMPLEAIIRKRIFAGLLVTVYIVFTWTVLKSTTRIPVAAWLIGILAGAYVADLLSGVTHIVIDFGTSNRKTPLHKELFLSRVHHHELNRPAKLNYAALWFSPALYSFVILALLPTLFLKIIPHSINLSWLAPLWLSILWFSSISQVSHAFAHGKASLPLTKKIIRFLQGVKLIIPPQAHHTHHREIDRNFSVLNGWSNPLLNLIFKKWIESRLSDTTTPARQKADMKKKLSYPYEEIL